ncbi:hypothetical protein DXT57_07485 [Stenotrophomonas maltophilia]|nr:hypothetical protein DXT57_07485 [Stenotrophomonas maltophilia]
MPAAGRQPQQQKQKRASRGMAGRCGCAGHAVNPSVGARWRHPWRQRSCTATPPHLRQIPAAVGRCRPWSTHLSDIE